MISQTNVISPSDEKDAGDVVCSMRTFTERTTMHGCQSVMQTDYHVIRRLIWAALILVSTGLFLNAFIRGISQYCSYPSSISIDVQHNRNLALPDITVCNNNFLSKSFVASQDPSVQKFISDPANADVSISVNTTDFIGMMYGGMDPLDKFISNCIINLKQLDCEKHVQRSVSWLGGCYTISLMDFPLENTRSVSGFMFQISLIVSEYSHDFRNHAHGVGAILMFHQHGEQPNDGLAVNVAPDTVVQVAVRKSYNVRLGTPYNTKDCRAEQMVDYHLSTRYTVLGCEMQCFFNYFEQQVGCDYAGKVAGLRNCSLLEVTRHGLAAWDHTYSSECVCPHLCNETIYHTDSTTMAHEDTFLSASPAEQRVKKISVSVYYPTLDVNIVTQKPSYDLNSFIADVGGQMGLFLGASLLTLSEFFEFFVMCIIKKLK